MEKRLSRFIKNRRSRLSEPTHEKPTFQKVPTSGSPLPSPKRPAFFTSQPRAQNASNNEVGDSDATGDSLRSFAYDSCAVGRPPTFVTKAQPGNGPVKLQANRRLSTGELIATTQEGALKDIRDGEYVVGKKERPASRSQRKSTVRAPSNATFGQSTPTSPASTTAASPRTWPGSIPLVEPSRSMPCVLGEHIPADATNDLLDLGLVPSVPANQSRFSRTSRSRESIKSYRTLSGDASATLVALKKAEYSRMSDLYGPEAAAIKLARTSSTPSSPLLQTLSPTSLEPSKTFDEETKEEISNPSNRLSGTSGSYYEESLEASSPQRSSYVSSHAGSSNATAPTSFTDEECITSREDIKSMVEQIRSTYLAALDTHTSPPQTTKSKKKKKPKSTLSGVAGSLEKTRPKVSAGRQTWHPEGQPPELSFRRRVNSHPVNAVGRLPPIPASPTREVTSDLGIKRADSTTLGEIMADMTRASIRAQRSSQQAEDITRRNVLRPTTPASQVQKAKESWLSLDSDVTEDPFLEPTRDGSRLLQHSHVASTAPPKYTQVNAAPVKAHNDFEELYQDLFGKDADTLWSSSSLFSDNDSSLLITHSGKNGQHSNQFSTPRKPPRITSIPESPEYTHLADPHCPEGRFI